MCHLHRRNRETGDRGAAGAERPSDRELGVALVGLRDEIARPFRPALIMLTAAVVGVLLIA